MGFSIRFTSTLLGLSDETLIDEIEPVVSNKLKFGNREDSTKINTFFEICGGSKSPMQVSKQMISRLNSAVEQSVGAIFQQSVLESID